MKKEEVRIGIYLQWKDNGSIFAVDMFFMINLDFWNHIERGDIIPIPLSVEWLIDFGFKKVEEHIYLDKNDVAVFYSEGIYTAHLIMVDYVHQLQTVYLAADKIDLVSEKYPL